MTGKSAHRDSFARDHLPAAEDQPVYLFDRPEFQFPAQLNCAVEMLDKQVAAGHGDRPCLISPRLRWTYAELLDKANRIAKVLREDLGLVPGNRVMLRGANNPMVVACWFGIVKAGGVVVATMPLLRSGELAVMLDKAEIGLALCDRRLMEDMEKARDRAPVCERIVAFDGSGEAGGGAELEALMAAKDGGFDNVETASDDVALIAFTSGTTGKPKGTMHFHRDVIAINNAFPRSVLKPTAEDVFIGSPPIAFTFGLGGLVTFPLSVGASTVLLEKASPDALASAIAEFGVTVCFTAPTAYRALIKQLQHHDISSLKKCVSAGETLPLPIFEDWLKATGIRIIDGIGATEMLHIFISAAGDEIRPGATGKPIPGYEARVVDENMQELPPGEVGRLAVRGPTGCRYLADERQKAYVCDGWNLTGDAYRMDADGYFWFQARADDMIVSSGYNISGPEVEEALMAHQTVRECAVVAAPDAERGTIVKAFVVLEEGQKGEESLVKALQDHVKASIAPYKYPRAIEFIAALPRTETGKVQRFRLRLEEEKKAEPQG
ncbi:MAG: benzoate-CoA ligase family protein [Rhodovibrionaceae bacterium]